MVVGAAKDRDPSAFEILDRVDVGSPRHDEIHRRVRAAGSQNACLQTVRPRDDLRQIAVRGEIKLAVGECLINRRTRTL